MRKIGPDFIDYWQGSCDSAKSLRSRFGLRLRDGHIWVLVKFGDEPPNTHGIGYPIPVAIESLPAYVAMIVNDHLLNYPSSDLMDVLTGKEFCECRRDLEACATCATFEDPEAEHGDA